VGDGPRRVRVAGLALMDFDAALVGFAALDEEALARSWSWRGGQIDVHYALYRTLEEAQEAYVQAAAGQHPESRRILALAQRAFGDLRGLLVGLPADLLEVPPRRGEWSIGETLRHLRAVEQRYALHTLYAVERSDSDPVRIPDDRLPPTAPTASGGDLGVLLAQLAEARADTNRRLGDVAPASMTRPTIWMHWEIDVRFRLHRFAAHLAEHIVQCEKTLAALVGRQPEGRRIVRRLTAAIGELEGLGALAEANEIEARLTERFTSVTASV
jgi:DinB superfamily